MRALRIMAYGIGVVLAALVLGIIAVALLVKPDGYKERIIREVRVSTGRDLKLPGAIKLSVFPWVALELGPASLGNPPGFAGGDFVSVEHVALRVKLLPLLHKQLQVGRIEIDQLNLNLQKNAAGKANWENFGTHQAEGGSSVNESAHTGSILQGLAGVTISNSRIHYHEVSINKLNLAIGTVTRQFGLTHLRVTGELKSGAGATALPFVFTAPAVNVDLNNQTLQVAQFAGQFASAKVSGTLNGERIVAQPIITGALALEPVALRSFTSQLGIQLPKTRNAQAFSRFSAGADFEYSDKSVQLRNIQAQLDDSRLQGAVAVADLDTLATTFTLRLDQIDIDRYRSPVLPADTQTSMKPAQLPSGALKTLDLQGSFAVGSAKFSGLTLTAVKLSLQAKEGLIQLAPLTADMYGGQYSGDISYDVRGAAPQLQLNQKLVGVDMSALLKDGINSARVSGHGNASTSLTARGPDGDALMKSLNGRVELSLANGSIAGADLPYEIGMAQALLKGQPPPAGSNTRHTSFDALQMSAIITAGVAKTNDLLVATPYLRVTGQGSADLVSKAVDLRLLATVLTAPPNAQGTDLAQLTLAQIPVSVTGTANEPKVRPDLQGLLRSQLQHKAKDLIKDKLKGFLGTH